LVVLDKQTNATALTILNVLKSVSPISQKNLDNRHRFTILHDQSFSIEGQVATVSGGISQVVHNWYKKCNITVQFNNGNAGTVADIQSGSLYLIFIGDEGAGATAGFAGYSVRVRYQDQ